MKLRILVVGSRDYPKRRRVKGFMRCFPKGTVVVSGGARGVDTFAERAANSLGLETDIRPADWDRHGRSAGYIRNAEMVASEPDCCVAFWDGRSRGTKHTVELCKENGIPVLVIGPEGDILEGGA